MTGIKKPDLGTDDALAGLLSDEIGSGVSGCSVLDALDNRVARYSEAKKATSHIVSYLSENLNEDIRFSKMIPRVRDCGSYLVFNNYYLISQVKLSKAYFCMHDRLCRFCAMRRAARYIEKYRYKLDYLLSQNPDLKPYFVTFTVKNSFDLPTLVDHLKNSVKKFNQARRDHARGHRSSIFGLFESGVMTFELTHSEKGWHPHVHILALLPRDLYPDEFPWEFHPDKTGKKRDWSMFTDLAKKSKLSKAWHKLTGDSFIVDARPVYDKADSYSDSVTGAFLETFKYALKFSTLSPEMNVEAYCALKGRRLLNSWGDFRGIPEPDLTDDIEQFKDQPYLRLVYRYSALGFKLTDISPSLLDVDVDGVTVPVDKNGVPFIGNLTLDEFLTK